jgi:AAA15 family ATPase/GTPase
MEISISKFKKINSAKLTLGPLNIFIGANNSGKSSFIQAIQFAVSSCQTLQLNRVGWTGGNSKRMALESIEFLYTPTRHIENLYHGQVLTGARKSEDRKKMRFSFNENAQISTLEILRGRNGGFTTILTGKSLGDRISSLATPFCVYVPGLAGIPVQEKYEVPISIKKSATRGDSNNFLRNIILDISEKPDIWNKFKASVASIYPNVEINAVFNKNTSEFIEVNVKSNGHVLPIDSVGTGMLQVIQVFAYIEYFNPSLILLDEPDAHIHPTKQKALAYELIKRTVENPELKVVFSTHSRYILEALEGKANVFHFHDGAVIPDVQGSKILLDIGAADADYLFSKKDLKYVVVTEDKVDNILEKKEFLKKFLLANDLSEDEFVLHSYEGCTKVDFAKILQDFVAKQIPTIKIIVHFDRDQRFGEDPELLKLQTDCEKRGIKLFITEYSELENYFCSPEHISISYGIEISKAEELYNQILNELEAETKRKIKNFIGNSRSEFSKNASGRFDITVLDAKTDSVYEAEKNSFDSWKRISR